MLCILLAMLLLFSLIAFVLLLNFLEIFISSPYFSFTVIICLLILSIFFASFANFLSVIESIIASIIITNAVKKVIPKAPPTINVAKIHGHKLGKNPVSIAPPINPNVTPLPAPTSTAVPSDSNFSKLSLNHHAHN